MLETLAVLIQTWLGSFLKVLRQLQDLLPLQIPLQISCSVESQQGTQGESSLSPGTDSEGRLQGTQLPCPAGTLRGKKSPTALK